MANRYYAKGVVVNSLKFGQGIQLPPKSKSPAQFQYNGALSLAADTVDSVLAITLEVSTVLCNFKIAIMVRPALFECR